MSGEGAGEARNEPARHAPRNGSCQLVQLTVVGFRDEAARGVGGAISAKWPATQNVPLSSPSAIT